MDSRLVIRRLDTRTTGFRKDLKALLRWEASAEAAVESEVRDIVGEVRTRGDAAVLEYTRRFDGLGADSLEALTIRPQRFRQAFESLDDKARHALEVAAERIAAYHSRQRLESWSFEDEHGNRLAQRVTALDRVGVYVPGGKAAYPSSVLMNVIPARIAGVDDIVVVTPAPRGEVSAMVLAAAHIAKVNEAITIGGAQAIAALAYGTESVQAVDKITGPGNAYVAAAKRLVFGAVGIDMIAGPSEILVISDGSSHARWVAMDLFSQAEHDEQARAVLVCTSDEFLDRVEDEIAELLPEMERADIIHRALSTHGLFIKVDGLEEAFEVANTIAPEHLELAFNDAEAWLPKVRHAGSIFVGERSCEVLGDYCAGPNHVLPTAGTARFSSPLGVHDFQKRSGVIVCSAQGARRLGEVAVTLAQSEGLTAHARAAALRLEDNTGDG